ncbi:PAS domain-containing protein [Zobellia galactanivorans]|uniref:PAS domain-containing protein n=1 Tax=Zobellia galactanivorans (strain DSM 12802 / CCUG 47099 / CIP 106680 / NCIMB 13871 / Dsij) TaxID=63186 RepID=UPI002090AD27|nr:PAS domain-containing protein [Zobellia galactanivorans]
MDFKRIYQSSKTYIVLLIISFAIILFTANMAYYQIMRMQDLAEKVAHTLQVNNAISELSAHYTQAESEEFRKQLKTVDTNDALFNSYKEDGTKILDTLKKLTANDSSQQIRLAPMQSLLDTLYEDLYNLSQEPSANSDTLSLEDAEKLQKNNINFTLYRIRNIKNQMLAEERLSIKNARSEYDTNKYLAPLTSLLLAFFALLVFVLAFFKIYRNKLRIRRSEGFLRSVLATTDNIVNYYEPIFDTQKKIIDFKITFANECNRDYLGLDPEKIIGEPISKVFPFLMLNGEFEKLVTSYTEKTKITLDRQISGPDQRLWFKSIITPLADGIMVTARNSTAEEKAKEEQLLLNQQLEEQNLKLLDHRAFLNNIFKSISHVVMNFESVRDGSGAIIDFKILFINDKITPITGDLPQEIINKNISSVFPTIFETEIFGYLKEVVNSGKPTSYEVPYEVDGKTKWFSARAIKLGDGITLTTREITEEKEKTDELLHLNTQLETQNSIFIDAENVANIGSYIWYLDNGEATISDNFYRILGYEPNTFKVTYDSYRKFVHPDDREMYDRLGKETSEHGQSQVNGYRIITKQGDVKHIELNGRSMIRNGRKVSVGVVLDVTEEKEKTNRVAALNQELSIQNSILTDAERIAKIGSFIWHVGTDEIEISDNFYRMIGFEPKGFKSSLKAFRKFIHPEDVKMFDENIENSTKELKVKEHRYRIITTEGEVKHFEVNGQLIEKNNTSVMLGVAQDITQNIAAEEKLRASNLQLQHSNAELESFNRVASHDLQEPLRKTQMFISRLESTEAENLSEKGRIYFQKVVNAASRMQSLVLNLLTYSRIDSKHEDFDLIDLNEVLKKVKEDLSSNITDTGALIKSEDLPSIKGVSYQLEQLFNNLISNALKYRAVEAVPTITIQAEKVHSKQIPENFFKTANTYYKITVIDNGIGFSSEHAEKIFEVFQRLHQKSEYSGTGIGLAICKKIIENHHGFIYATSELGKGSAFVFYLPA